MMRIILVAVMTTMMVMLITVCDDDENDKGHRDRDDLISMIIVSVRKL